MAAHRGYSCFGGDTGPRAAFVEHHCYSLAAQGTKEILGDRAGLDGRLVGGGIANQGCEFSGCEVSDGE